MLRSPLQSWWLLSSVLAVFSLSHFAMAQQVRYVEQDGVLYQETRFVERTPVAEVRLADQQQTRYVEQFHTEIREVKRNVWVPKTEYRPAPPVQGRWPLTGKQNNQLVPQTRWEQQTQTVNVPLTRREVIPETHVVKVPTRVLRFVEAEKVSRVALGPAPRRDDPQLAQSEPSTITIPTEPLPSSFNSPRTASRTGGLSRFDSDPPRRPVPATDLGRAVWR